MSARHDSQAILCICPQCGTGYALGVNAVVTVFDEAPNLEAPPGRRRTLTLGGGSHQVPDLIGLEYGKSSWPRNKPAPFPGGPVPAAVLEAREKELPREWQCQICKSVQGYPWIASPPEAVASLQSLTPEPTSPQVKPEITGREGLGVAMSGLLVGLVTLLGGGLLVFVLVRPWISW